MTENEPSPRELDVLKALWALGSGTVREVHRRMYPDDERAFNTVQTLLRIMDIEIVRYVAPIIVINATTKELQQIKDFKADVQYTHPGPDNGKTAYLVGGGNKKEAIQDEQYDGRYWTLHMLPDKEVKVTVSADGRSKASRNLALPEGKTEEVSFVLEPK